MSGFDYNKAIRKYALTPFQFLVEARRDHIDRYNRVPRAFFVSPQAFAELRHHPQITTYPQVWQLKLQDVMIYPTRKGETPHMVVGDNLRRIL